MTRFRRSTFPRLALSAGLALGAAAGQAQSPEAAPAADAFLPAEDEAFLLTEPTTPEEFFRAVVLAQRLARPNLARGYLQGFLAGDPDDELLLRLRDEYGPAVFSRLANQPELQPLSTQFADRVAEVVRRRGGDPRRIAALIDALAGPAATALPARDSLVNAGQAVIPDILLRFPQADEVTTRRLLDALVAMGEPALPALHAALDAPSDELRIQLLSVLARIGSRLSIPHLYYPAYAPEQPAAVRSAARQAISEIARVSRLAADSVEPADVAARLAQVAVDTLSSSSADDEAAGGRVWSWDPQAGTVRPADAPPRVASLFEAAAFARRAFLLAPDRQDLQAVYLALLLGYESTVDGGSASTAGPDTAFNRTLAAGPDTAAEVLRQAVRHRIPRAAVAALAAIARTGSSSLLYGDEDVVRAALDAPDPRTQLAAAVAVLTLNPDRPFRGSGRVVEILARALADRPEPTAVIIDPNAQRGQTVAGFVRELGYEVAFARSGQQGFAAAARQVQPAFLLVNLNVSQWPLSQTLANLRADVRTRDVPVVVYGPQAGEWEAEPVVGSSRATLWHGTNGAHDPRSAVRRAISQTPATAYVEATTTTGAFAAQLRPVLAQLVVDPVTADERREARAVAAFRLAQIADTGQTEIFPLTPAEPALVEALSDPAIAENALLALAAVPTESAQRAVAEYVLGPSADGPARVAATAALTDHVRRFGLLLPEATVSALQNLWRETTDAELKTALTAWGGTLRPGTARVRYELEAAPPAAPPAAQP